MTGEEREKALETLKNEWGFEVISNDAQKALDMAIKVLEQEPTAKENLVVEDCISREFIEIVVDYPPADLCTYPEYKGKPYFSIKYRENGKTYVGFGTYKIEILSQWIKEYFMPSIQPKPKTGHWEQYGYSWEDKFKCSECGKEQPKILCGERIIGHWSDYCPNCGADMRESEE